MKITSEIVYPGFYRVWVPTQKIMYRITKSKNASMGKWMIDDVLPFPTKSAAFAHLQGIEDKAEKAKEEATSKKTESLKKQLTANYQSLGKSIVHANEAMHKVVGGWSAPISIEVEEHPLVWWSAPTHAADNWEDSSAWLKEKYLSWNKVYGTMYPEAHTKITGV